MQIHCCYFPTQQYQEMATSSLRLILELYFAIDKDGPWSMANVMYDQKQIWD